MMPLHACANFPPLRAEPAGARAANTATSAPSPHNAQFTFLISTYQNDKLLRSKFSSPERVSVLFLVCGAAPLLPPFVGTGPPCHWLTTRSPRLAPPDIGLALFRRSATRSVPTRAKPAGSGGLHAGLASAVCRDAGCATRGGGDKQGEVEKFIYHNGCWLLHAVRRGFLLE